MEQEKMSGKTLLLITRPLSEDSSAWTRLALRAADSVVLIQDGVFNTASLFSEKSAYGTPGGHRAAHSLVLEEGLWPDKCAALEEDAAVRGRKSGVRLINYAQLVEAIAGHEKIITL